MIQLGLLSIRDVNARADITKKRTVDIKTRCTTIEHPAILAVLSAQAILHCERLSFVESSLVNRQAVREVLRVNAFGPAVTQFLIQSAASEFQPALIKEIAELVRTRHPDHDGRGIRHRAKAHLAFKQRLFRQLAFRDIRRNAVDPARFAICAQLDTTARMQPAYRSVG